MLNWVYKTYILGGGGSMEKNIDSIHLTAPQGRMEAHDHVIT